MRKSGTNKAGAVLRELERLLPVIDAGAARRKRQLLTAVQSLRLRRARQVVALQRIACFMRAFPADAPSQRAVRRLAAGFAARTEKLARAERASLDDTGTAGTVTRHVYAAAAVLWMQRRFPRSVDIDWQATEAAEAVARILDLLFDPLEAESMDRSGRGLRAWLTTAKGGSDLSDLGWLLAQAPSAGPARREFLRAFDAAQVPITWRLDDRAGITGNALAASISVRAEAMRRAAGGPDAVRQPLEVERLSPRAATRLLDVWRAALWSRTRTVFQIEQPNLDECYLADFGAGLKMAAVGVRAEHRGALEATYGYLLLANGMPIGYGGFTALFAQVNTGINVFPEFRGSEAAFAFEQALRAMHALTGNLRFIINPYQFGAGNDEALASGAYWFYFRLGFRSAAGTVRRLAEREYARLCRDRGYRVPLATLRKLATCDLYLDLGDEAPAKFFDESWLPRLAHGITETLAREGLAQRAEALSRLSNRLAGMLGVELARWSPVERRGFAQFAPLLGQVDGLEDWPRADRQALAPLARLRWAPQERDYIARLRVHDRLREALARTARRA